MNKGSKQRNDLIKRIEDKWKKVKEKLFHCEMPELERIASLSGEDILLQRVATNQNIKERDAKLILRFDFFREDECIFHQMDEVKTKSLLEKFKRFTTITLSEFPSSRLVRDEVTNVHPYNSLFTYLTPDVERLKETELSSGRVFYFVDEPESCVQVVSVETKHRSND
jgi:hypothetical protein